MSFPYSTAIVTVPKGRFRYRVRSEYKALLADFFLQEVSKKKSVLFLSEVRLHHRRVGLDLLRGALGDDAAEVQHTDTLAHAHH